MVYSRRPSPITDSGPSYAYPLSSSRRKDPGMPALGSLDLEAGGSYDAGKRQSGTYRRSQRGGCSGFLVSCCSGGSGGSSRKWAVVATFQTAIIVGLLLYIGKNASASTNRATDEQRGPRVSFVDEQGVRELEHLIMVPGHGVTMTESLDGADHEDVRWFLLDYQKDKDVPHAIVGHIQGGLDELAADESALLLFSGGKTRVVAGPKSEGESYFFVADHYNWWGKPDLRARASTEDFARDSFENLLFSICRFKEVTGNYPTKITVVGYDFKKERFEGLHREALRFPSDNFQYVGLHAGGNFDQAAAESGERSSAVLPYQADPYGCAEGGPLVAKRLQRNPFHRTSPYTLACPEMKELLEWCGPELFAGSLPWSTVEGKAQEDGGGKK